MYKAPGKCCVCGGKLSVTRLHCDNCGSDITGNFEGCRFCALPKEQSEYLITFLRCRGNIKEKKKEQKILSHSQEYVRKSSLRACLSAKEPAEGEVLSKTEILKMLERKEISSAEAMKMIKELQ